MIAREREERRRRQREHDRDHVARIESGDEFASCSRTTIELPRRVWCRRETRRSAAIALAASRSCVSSEVIGAGVASVGASSIVNRRNELID
jgi:hypothetical protein